MQGINQDKHCPKYAEVPKKFWYNYSFMFFRQIPLHNKTQEKDKLSKKSKNKPGVFECVYYCRDD